MDEGYLLNKEEVDKLNLSLKQPVELRINVSEVKVICNQIELTLAGKNDVLDKTDRLIINLPNRTIEFLNIVKLSEFFKCPICGRRVEKINDRTFKLPCACNSGLYQV